MAALSVKLLGPFQAELRGNILSRFRTCKVQALLIYLLVEEAFSDRHVVHERKALMALLWPDTPVQCAQSNLRQTLFHLRRSIPGLPSLPENGPACQPFLISDRRTIEINPSADYYLDVSEFLACVRENADLNLRNSYREQLQAAVSVYQGDFLANFSVPECNPFEEWTLLTRERLKRLAVNTLYALTRIQLQEGDFEEAEQSALKQLEIDNLREPAYQQMMESLARRGLRCEAILQYRKCREVLEREIGVQPTSETMTLADMIRSGTLDPKPYLFR